MKSFRVSTVGRMAALLVPVACSSGVIGGNANGLSPDGSAGSMGPLPDGSTPPGADAAGAPADASVPLEATAPATACTTAAAGTASTYDAMGSGTGADPYLLCNASQVVALSGAPAAWKFSFRLGADIDLGSNGATSASPFKMIGTTKQPFTGTFDGAGHAISNVQVSLPTTTDVGFFGVVLGGAAEVRGLNITGASITGYEDVAILAGRCDRSCRILGSSAQGTVTGTDRVGGLVGSGIYGTVISSSWASATVTATGSPSFAGGLAGLMGQGLFVFNSFSGGTVNGRSHAGGLLGSTDSGAVYNSYSTAKVVATDPMADGIGGFGGACGGTIFQNCFATGDVTASTSNTTIGRFIGDPAYGTVTNDFDLSTSICQITPTQSCPADSKGETLAQLEDTTRLPLSGWDLKTTWSASSGALPTPNSVLFDANTWDGCAAHATDTPVAGGDGTPDRPYLICSASQFASLASNPALRTGTYILQMAPIDFAMASVAPVGGSGGPLIGEYNGNGKPLSNFTVNASSGDVGLFGTVTGALTRVAAINGAVTGGGSANNTGILVGSLYGTVNDCYATGTVTGPGNVAGLGNAHTTLGSYSNSTVTATSGVAGGLNSTGGADGSVVDSFASSTVHASSGNAYALTPGVNSASQVMDSFYDSTKCSGCTNVDATSEATSYFYSTTNAPFTNWDFDNVWMAQANGFPTLR
jgi:hypothetical protein